MEPLCGGGLNENVPHRLKYLNTWPPSSPVIGAVGGGGGAALLEEAYHGVRGGVGFGSLQPPPTSSSLCQEFGVKAVISHLPLLWPATMLSARFRTLLRNCEPR